MLLKLQMSKDNNNKRRQDKSNLNESSPFIIISDTSFFS